MNKKILSLLVASAAAIAQDEDCSADPTGCEATFVCALDIADSNGEDTQSLCVPADSCGVAGEYEASSLGSSF